MIWFWIFGVPIAMALLGAWLEHRKRNKRDITFTPPSGNLRLDERTRKQIVDNRQRGTGHGWREAKE